MWESGFRFELQTQGHGLTTFCTRSMDLSIAQFDSDFDSTQDMQDSRQNEDSLHFW